MINQQKFPAKQVPLQNMHRGNYYRLSIINNAWCVGRKQTHKYYLLLGLSFCVHKQTGSLRSFLFHHAKILAVFVKAKNI